MSARIYYQNDFAFNNLFLNGTANATSSTTGAFQIAGGISVNGISYHGANINLGGNLINNVANPLISTDVANKSYVDTSISTINSTTTTRSGQFIITNTTLSNSTGSGALQVYGGVGIGSTLNIGGEITIYPNNTGITFLGGSALGVDTFRIYKNTIDDYLHFLPSNNTSTAGFKFMNTADTNSNFAIDSVNGVVSNLAITINNSTISTSSSTGALKVLGGIGSGNNIYANGLISANNNSYLGSTIITNPGTFLGYNRTGNSGTTLIANQVGTGLTGGFEFINYNTANAVSSIPLTILATGFIGIGNTNPQYQLDFGATSRDRILSLYTGASSYFGFGVNNNVMEYLSNTDHVFFTNSSLISVGTERLRLTATGNLGINTTNPSFSLDVNGSSRFVGIANFQNTTASTSSNTGSIIISGGLAANSIFSNSFSTANLNINIANSNTNTALTLLEPNLGANNNINLQIGTNTTNGNVGFINFLNQTVGSVSNTMNLGILGNNAQLTLQYTTTSGSGSGFVGINNINPNYQLDLIGSFRNNGINLFTNTTNSSSVSSGSLILSGGLGVNGNIYATTIFQNGIQTVTIAGTNTSISGGIVSIISNPTFAGITTISNTTNSTNTSNGALIVSGGIGAGTIYSQNHFQNGAQVISIAGTNTSVSGGILSVISNPIFAGIVNISNTTNSSTTNNGALIIAGGLGVGNIYGQNIYQNNSQTISIAGTNTSISGGILSVVSNPTFLGITTISNSTNSTNTATGALIIAGGLGVGNIYGQNIFQNGNQVFSIAGTNLSTSAGIASVVSNPTFSGIVNVSNTTNSTTLTTGALIVSGGLGVTATINSSSVNTGAITASGTVNITNSTNSINTTSGALIIAGGLGVGNIYGQNVFQNGNQVVSIAGTNISTSAGILSVISNPTFSGITTISNTSSSTSTATGALIVAGGIGSGNIYSQNIFQNANQVVSVAGTNISTSAGILSVISNPTFSGITTISNTSSSSSTASGALIIAGGLGVGNIYGQNIFQNGNQVFSIAGTNLSTSAGITSVISNPTFSGVTTISNTTNSTNLTTGALVVSGGLGIVSAINSSSVNTGAITATGTVNISNSTNSTNTASGALIIAGGLGVGSIYGQNIFQNANQVFSIAGTNLSNSAGIASVISNPTFSGIVNISNTTNSSNTGNGALIIAGGIGVSGSIYSGNQFQNGNQVASIPGTNISISAGIISVISNPSFAGITTITNSTVSNNTASGALIVAGGIGSGTIYSQNIFQNANQVASIAGTNISTSAGILSVISNPTFLGITTISNTTSSSNTATGALIVAGGIGSGTIYSQNIFQNANQVVSVAGTNISTSAGILSVISNPTFSGITTISNTTSSSSTATGALIIGGGLGINGTLYGGNMFQNNAQVMSIAGTNLSTSNGIVSLISNPSITSLSVGAITSSATSSISIAGTVGATILNLFQNGMVQNSTNSVNLILGVNGTNFNAGIMYFVYAGGSGSTLNTINLGINGGPLVNINGLGNVNITSTTASISTATGALVVNGGIGAGIIYSRNHFQNGAQVISIAGTNTSVAGGILSVISNPTFAGITTISNSTVSSTTNNGALIVSGGIGAGTIYSQNHFQNGAQVISIAGTNTSVAGGILSVISNPTFTGITTISNSTVSSNTNNGALIVTGGLGISGTINSSVINSGTITGTSSSITGLSQIIFGGTTTSNAFNIFQPSLSINNNINMLIGVSTGNGNSGFINFINQTSNSISNTMNLGIQGNTPQLSLQYSSTSSGTGFVGINNTNPSYQLDLIGTSRLSGIALFTNTAVSSNTATGSVIISGGLGVNGSIYGGSIFSNGAQVLTNAANTFQSISITGTNSSALTVAGGVGIAGNVAITATTVSNNATTGALTVAGGLGIAGSLNVSGSTNTIIDSNGSSPSNPLSILFPNMIGGFGMSVNLYLGKDTTISYNSAIFTYRFGNNDSDPNSTLSIGLNSGNQIIMNGTLTRIVNLSITGTTNAVSNSTGALTVAGGLGVSGTVYCSTLNANTINATSLIVPSINATSLSQVTLSSTAGGNAFNLLDSNLSNGSNIFLGIGTNISSGNSGFLNFMNVTTGSTSNSMNLGIFGQANNMITLQNNGFVGINNQSPAYQLDVAGQIRLSSTLTIGNSTASTFLTILGSNSAETRLFAHSDGNSYLQTFGSFSITNLNVTSPRISVDTSGNLLTLGNTICNTASAPVLLGANTGTFGSFSQGLILGWNRTGGSGTAMFGNNLGGGQGGFEWVNFNQNGSINNVGMTLSATGFLTTGNGLTVSSGTVTVGSGVIATSAGGSLAFLLGTTNNFQIGGAGTLGSSIFLNLPLQTKALIPSSTVGFDIGSISFRYGAIFAMQANVSNNINIGTSTGLSTYPLNVTNSFNTTVSSPFFVNGTGSVNGPATNFTGTFSAIFASRILASEFWSTSDQREKCNITDLDLKECLDFVKDIKPVTFSWNDSKDKHTTGYIAQEVFKKSSIQGLVNSTNDESMEEFIDEEGFCSPAKTKLKLSYEKIIPILHKVILSVIDKNNNLEKQNLDLLNRLEILENLILKK